MPLESLKLTRSGKPNVEYRYPDEFGRFDP
jgi:hypothetical protein